MPWPTLLNHESNIERFQKSFRRNRLANTYLFVGQPGIGKRRFAKLLAQTLLCENPPEEFAGCGHCSACQQVAVESHPDLIFVSKPADKAYIPLELFIGDKEHRRQQGLCHDISLKPFRGGRKIAIVDDADALNQEGANSLLKTLEEPPPKSMLILIGTSEQRQLPTIISRAQVIRFEPLTNEQMLTVLQQQTDLETDVPLESLAIAAEGSMQRAFQLADPDTFEFRHELFAKLATCDPGVDDFAKTVTGFVDSAGKEGAAKRERLTMIADFSIRFFEACYRQVMASLAEPGSPLETQPAIESKLQESVAAIIACWQSHDVGTALEIAGQAIERNVELQSQVHANVNTATAVEAWLIDLGRICRGKSLFVS